MNRTNRPPPLTSMKFESRKLFGGAMAVNVPDNYYDVSDVRQVPDTQEVFQEREGIHNVILDVLEHVDIVDPLEAARFHLEDYVDGDGDLKVWKIGSVDFPHLPDDCMAVSLLATTSAKEDMQTAIFLLLVRLPEHSTDLLITTNMHDISVPDVTEYDTLFQDSEDGSFKNGRQITQQIVDTFAIKDYALFHPEDA